MGGDICVLKNFRNEIIHGSLGNPIFGLAGTAPEAQDWIIVLGYRSINFQDALRLFDFRNVPGSRFPWDHPPVWSQRDVLPGNPDKPPTGASNDTTEVPQMEYGGSHLLQLLDPKGNPFGEIIHFNAQTDKWSELSDKSMIRVNGIDDSCELGRANNVTIPGCGSPPPPPSLPSQKICEVHEQVYTAVKKKCTATKTFSTYTMCHDPIVKQNDICHVEAETVQDH